MHYLTDLLNGESNKTCKKNVFEKEAIFFSFSLILIFITVM